MITSSLAVTSQSAPFATKKNAMRNFSSSTFVQNTFHTSPSAPPADPQPHHPPHRHQKNQNPPSTQKTLQTHSPKQSRSAQASSCSGPHCSSRGAAKIKQWKRSTTSSRQANGAGKCQQNHLSNTQPMVWGRYSQEGEQDWEHQREQQQHRRPTCHEEGGGDRHSPQGPRAAAGQGAEARERGREGDGHGRHPPPPGKTDGSTRRT
jgi:hypothetical protein